MTREAQDRILSILRDGPAAEAGRWLRRADLQIGFARAFTASLPAEATAGWGERIDEAERLLDAFSPSGALADLETTVRAMEQQMGPIGEAAKTYRIHCVGHGHIDMNWMWSWPETVATTHDTFASVLRLMEEYPDFTYSQSQASVYALIERYHPAQFERIRQRVQEGRWEITAAHWVEGDKNLASGESLCRHMLYTRRYIQEKFGLSPEDLPIDWEPDTFGHAVTIPSILAQGAVRYYYSCRQGGGFEHARVGDARPPLFYWQGPDGARILVNRETTWYNSYVNIGDNIALPLARFVGETTLHDWLNVYGVGNHGGGPTRAEIDYYHEIQQWPIYPQVLFSTSKRYFDAVEQEIAGLPADAIPTIAHELNYEFTGCYTTQTLIKQANRFGENYLEEAETLALLASRLADRPYPVERLREAWINVLFNQFHDILPGSGIRDTREHALSLFQEVGAITGSIKRIAGKGLADRIDTLSLLPDTWSAREEREQVLQGKSNPAFESGAGVDAALTGFSHARGGGSRFRPVVIYNPCAWARSERVQVDLFDSGFNAGRVVARDDEGIQHPTLAVEQNAPWGHNRLRVAFDAVDVPPLGYRTYVLFEGDSTPLPADRTVDALPQDWFETPHLKFRLDRNRGGVSELIDKRTGASLVGPDGPLGAWAYVTERPRGMTAWALGEEVAAPLHLVSSSFGILGGSRNEGTGMYEIGSPAGYQAVWNLNVPGTQSKVRLALAIHATEPRLDIEASVDWREIGDGDRGIPGLVIRFPLALSNIAARYEAPFGSVERSLFGGEEVPSLRYAHVQGTARSASGEPVEAGVTLLQDCKYGHSLTKVGEDACELRLRIVRSSFDPDPTPEVATHTVRYSLFLHDKPSDPASLTRLGAAWNHPLMVLPVDLHGGEAPASAGFAEVLTANVVITALKRTEDGDGLLIRLVELNGEPVEAQVRIAPALSSGLTQVQSLDLLERPIEGETTWSEGVLHVAMPAHGVATIRLT